jgi:tetratricopeptide (TPR) repeat protein
MKQLTCEMCGNTDLLKQDGVFVCQSCGTKYSPEEAKKMMVEGVVEVTGTVRVDNTEKIKNYLVMANNAYGASNLKEAEEYANKIIEIDPENAESWFIKGKAAGWQSTIVNNRFGESIDCWTKTMEFSTKEDKEKYKNLASTELSKLAQALISTRATNFAKYPSNDNCTGLTGDYISMISFSIKLIRQIGTTALSDELNESIAKLMNGAAVAASNAATAKFGPNNSDRNRFALNTWMNAQDNCFAVWNSAINIATTKSTIRTIYSNAVEVQNSIIDSCSYKFEVFRSKLDGSITGNGYVKEYSLTDSAKSVRRKLITDMKATRDKKIGEIIAITDKYWREHPEEKETLEAKKAPLTKKSIILNAKIKALSETVDNLQLEIDSARREKDGLGIFGGGARKVLQRKILELAQEKTQAYDELNQAKAPLEAELEQVNRRIKEIDVILCGTLDVRISSSEL